MLKVIASPSSDLISCLYSCYFAGISFQQIFVFFEGSYINVNFCECLFCFAGEFHCPVLNKVFTEFTHIVAVKTTGNVFCYEVLFYL